MKYEIDDVALFDIFHTLADAKILQERMKKILEHIAGLSVDEGRRKDKSYEEHVRSMYQDMGITIKGFDRPELKIVRFTG